AAVRPDDAAQRSGAQLEALAARMDPAESLDEVGEELRDADAEPPPCLGEQPYADVHAPSCDREHPSVSGEERLVEEEDDLAEIAVDAGCVRALRNDRVPGVVDEHAGSRADDGVRAVRADDERRAVAASPATATSLDDGAFRPGLRLRDERALMHRC